MVTKEIDPNLRTIRDGVIDRAMLEMDAEAIADNEELFDDWYESLLGLPEDTIIDAKFVARQLGCSWALAEAILNAGWGDVLE